MEIRPETTDSSAGRDFARPRSMSARRALDRQAGPVPEIRVEGDSVTFRLDIAGTGRLRRLVLRCDEKGNVWASVAEPEGNRRMVK
jgi:hypothetical protein